MDLFGNERRRLRAELEELHAQNDKTQAQRDKTSAQAVKRQEKVNELERIIDDLRGEVARLKSTGGSSHQVSEAQSALSDALAIHSRGSR